LIIEGCIIGDHAHKGGWQVAYFITGATGFVGGRLARILREGGHEVIALVRDPSRAGDLAALGIRLHTGDVTDKASMRGGMAGAAGVFHVAGWYKLGLRDKTPGVKVNIEGTRNVLELMRELSIPRGVYTSTLAINSDTRGQIVDETYHYDGPHLSEYDRTKAEAHKIARQFIADSLPLVIVMPGLIYGPGDTSDLHDTWGKYLAGMLPALPQGVAYSWGYIDDIARAHILAMEKGRAGESYIIGGPAHTFIEAIQLAEKITGIPAPGLQMPRWAMRAFAGVMDVIDDVLPVPYNYTGEWLRVTAGVTYLGDNSKARRELGYDPRPLEDGLRETLAWEMARRNITPRQNQRP
jgi:nucleoside-diphosphate-sugar epimerase